MHQSRKMTIGPRQYIGPKIKNDFKQAGISHWNHNGTKLKNAFTNPKPSGISRKYKDLDIRVRNTAAIQAATASANNSLTISRINNIKRRSEALPLRPIMQNQQIIRPDRDGIQYVT